MPHRTAVTQRHHPRIWRGVIVLDRSSELDVLGLDVLFEVLRPVRQVRFVREVAHRHHLCVAVFAPPAALRQIDEVARGDHPAGAEQWALRGRRHDPVRRPVYSLRSPSLSALLHLAQGWLAAAPATARNVRQLFKRACKLAGIGDGWTPRELRTSFVSLMSHRGSASRRSPALPVTLPPGADLVAVLRQDVVHPSPAGANRPVYGPRSGFDQGNTLTGLAGWPSQVVIGLTAST